MNSKMFSCFSPEVRERVVRMVQEHRGEYPSLWACIESIAPKIGCVPQTLNGLGQAARDRYGCARGPLHSGTADGQAGAGRGTPGQKDAHHNTRHLGTLPHGSGQSSVQGQPAQ